jgi:hypothetical protein
MARAILSNEAKFRWFLNDTAGMGVNEYLGLGILDWLYHLKDMSFCGMLMTSVDSPHVYWLFPESGMGSKEMERDKTEH